AEAVSRTRDDRHVVLEVVGAVHGRAVRPGRSIVRDTAHDGRRYAVVVETVGRSGAIGIHGVLAVGVVHGMVPQPEGVAGFVGDGVGNGGHNLDGLVIHVELIGVVRQGDDVGGENEHDVGIIVRE